MEYNKSRSNVRKSWAIEELFKLIKNCLKMSNFTEQKKNNILKSLYANMILIHIVSFIDLSCKKINALKKDEESIKKTLLQGVLEAFIPSIFLKDLSDFET